MDERKEGRATAKQFVGVLLLEVLIIKKKKCNHLLASISKITKFEKAEILSRTFPV